MCTDLIAIFSKYISRQVQEVDLDKHIRLLDSPGVILEPKGRLDSSEIALKNAIRVESLADPAAAVQAILRRCSRDSVSPDMYFVLKETLCSLKMWR